MTSDDPQMTLKFKFSSDVIFKREEEIASKALSILNSIPNIEVLAGEISARLPIFSFMVRVPESDLYLHYNYVSALLNDLFGIQVRGGCVCAGPYGMELIGMKTENETEKPTIVQRFEKILLEDSRLDRIHLRRARESSQFEILRPGFVRFSLPYFFDDNLVEQVLQVNF
jgi:selenocysteine lyase/cysteine desulfurase